MTDRKTNFKTIWQRAKIRPILLLFAFQGIGFSLFLFFPLSIMTNSFTMVFPYYVAVIIFLIGLIFCLLLYLKIRKEIRLYKTGIIKNAKIISTSHNLGYTFTKFGSSMDVHYEYVSPNGNNNVGRSRTNNFAMTNSKSFGDKIRILVSKDGESSCLYPELIAKRNNWKENYVA